jgi:hypothetical protein
MVIDIKYSKNGHLIKNIDKNIYFNDHSMNINVIE